MSGISDNELIHALRRQMTIAAARQAAAAGNLANAETPGYKAVEVAFEETLDRASQALAKTDEAHLAANGAHGIELREKRGQAARRDGNTVEIDQELLAMGRAGGDFSKAQTALAAKFRLVRYAINEGK
jgi:flagellar basal-body rod protein FlgB